MTRLGIIAIAVCLGGAVPAPQITGDADLDELHTGVVLVRGCTGTYIGDGWVVTAAHCFDGIPLAEGTLSTISDPIIVYFVDQRAPGMTQVNPGGRAVLFPRFRSTSSPDDDVAVVSVNPVYVPAWAQAIPIVSPALDDRDASSSFEISGFGRTQAGPIDDPSNHTDGVRHHASQQLGELHDRTLDVDAPRGSDAHACFGDSGGPLLIQRPGDPQQYLAGVSSLEYDDCRGKNTYTRIDTGVNAQFIFNVKYGVTEKQYGSDPGCRATRGAAGWLPMLAAFGWLARRRRAVPPLLDVLSLRNPRAGR